MNFADLLTYADIDHLKRMASHYGCEREGHSKNGLITSLLYHLGGPSRLKGELDSLTPAEFRFLQLLCFDSRKVFSREDLLGKGRAAIDEEADEESPRDLLILGLRKGWVFPGVTGRNRTLFEVPEDLHRRCLRLFAEPYREQGDEENPGAYRNEEGLMEEDLHRFLSFLAQEEVRLTGEGAIYRQQQRQILKSFHVEEEPVEGKGWRFGFGRRYHQYPDRFSFLYDYAYYRGYILEDVTEGILRLSEAGLGKIRNNGFDEDREMYRFWLRLYRKPIPQIAVIVKWIDLLTADNWEKVPNVEKVVEHWLNHYYYETGEDLFKRILRMMLHLGLLRIGESTSQERLLRMNVGGHTWVSGVSGFIEKELETEYSEV